MFVYNFFFLVNCGDVINNLLWSAVDSPVELNLRRILALVVPLLGVIC